MLKGHQSWVFENRPVILSTGTVVGPDEGQGPIGEDFDIVHGDLTVGQKTWEKAEKALLEEAAQRALAKAGLTAAKYSSILEVI